MLLNSSCTSDNIDNDINPVKEASIVDMDEIALGFPIDVSI